MKSKRKVNNPYPLKRTGFKLAVCTLAKTCAYTDCKEHRKPHRAGICAAFACTRMGATCEEVGT